MNTSLCRSIMLKFKFLKDWNISRADFWAHSRGHTELLLSKFVVIIEKYSLILLWSKRQIWENIQQHSLEMLGCAGYVREISCTMFYVHMDNNDISY